MHVICGILKSVPLSIVLRKNVLSKNLVHEPCLVPPELGDDFSTLLKPIT